jgi:hypothetical protein
MPETNKSATLASEQVRTSLVDALHLDLIGPNNDHAFAREVLPDRPQQWYATGFLVPVDAQGGDKEDPTANEDVNDASDAQAVSEGSSDRVSPQKSTFPSSMGLTFLVPEVCRELSVQVQWGEYRWVGQRRGKVAAEGDESEEFVEDPTVLETAEGPSNDARLAHLPSGIRGYARIPCSATVVVPLREIPEGLFPIQFDGGDGLVLDAIVREVVGEMLPKGTRSVSLFLVNRRQAVQARGRGHESMVFQARLQVRCEEGFVPRPDLRGASRHAPEWDECLADLHYRDCFEFAVGHGASAGWINDAEICQEVQSEWMPQATVERVEAAELGVGVELSMDGLGALSDGESVRSALTPLVDAYRAWIEQHAAEVGKHQGRRRETADALVKDALAAQRRMSHGVELLATQPQVLKAFATANRAMSRSARQRRPDDRTPRWRPFQLAFVLLNLQGIADPTSEDRKTVDLLFFPTGGGKTEAYLGLAAFALVLRRLRHPDQVIHGKTVPVSAGVTVLMRYTLRLLTLDQMGRAAALMCALELERDSDKSLGSWPFEIGLWVGSAATPNRMGGNGVSGTDTAIARVRAFQTGSTKNSPIPLGNCPWCGHALTADSFTLVPNTHHPVDLKVACVNWECEFHGDRPLPIVAVDEPLYRRLPAFLLATVDKFAGLPWVGQAGALFGKVTHFDQAVGFSGPADDNHPGVGVEGGLLPPELVIQDELHLISGPLGTIAGLYETAIEALSLKDGVPPKILASTATVRRAEKQIRALFGRSSTSIFPPPGVDRRDSFFAVTAPAEENPGRLYVGFSAPGRSFKVLQMRVARAVLSRSLALWKENGAQRNPRNPADPYVTLLGYFNALRELGGFRRIAEDEIHSILKSYQDRRRRWVGEGIEDRLFTNRNIEDEVLELTSRVSTSDVAQTKVRLELPFSEKGSVDVALATNMISVGLDISRLGLMTVHGQPKSSAEYIQATSRVGRDPAKPGLVLTMLNVYKPRDRSHYEHFSSWHQSFYRSVEPTSVTPFSPRALDRALVGALIGAARHFHADLEPSTGAQAITRRRKDLEALEAFFVERVEKARPSEEPEDLERTKVHVQSLCRSLLDDWDKLAEAAKALNGIRYETGAKLLHDPLDPALKNMPDRDKRFKAGHSMRDVEPPVELWVK